MNFVEDLDDWTSAQGCEEDACTTYTMTGDEDYVVAVYSQAQGFVVTYSYEATDEAAVYELAGGQTTYFNATNTGDEFGVEIP